MPDILMKYLQILYTMAWIEDYPTILAIRHVSFLQPFSFLTSGEDVLHVYFTLFVVLLKPTTAVSSILIFF